MRILLIEDDRKAARLLARGLQEEGFVVDVVNRPGVGRCGLRAGVGRAGAGVCGAKGRAGVGP